MSMAVEEILPDGGIGSTAPRQRKVIEAVLRHARINGIGVGGRLPSIRDIASHTGIAHATVAKAIKHLSIAGMVESHGRNGTILVKRPEKTQARALHRLIMVQHIENPGVAALATSMVDFEQRHAVKVVSPGTDVVSVLHTPQDGDEAIEDLINYHYIYRGRPKNVAFTLGGCHAGIKRIFENLKVPSVIIGGREEGITLPHITTNIGVMVEQVMQILRDANAFPALFLVDLEKLFGEQVEMVRLFSEIAQKSVGSERHLGVLRTSSMGDVFQAQLTQALRTNRPRTIVARGDESATRAARVAMELGLINQIRFISMESGALGQRFIPSLTGLHRDAQDIIRGVMNVVARMDRGEDVSGVRAEVGTVMIFRESFPNPYTVPAGAAAPVASHVTERAWTQ